MHFKLSRASGWANPFWCLICDQRYPLAPFTIVATLYSDAGINWGEVCLTCYSLSAEQIQYLLYRKARFAVRIALDTAQLSREAVHKPDLTQEFQLYGGHRHE